MYVETENTHLVPDQVTGLGARGKLLADLSEAVSPDGPPALLVLFALDGFKEYEELYGVLDARKLLRRLGERLSDSLEDIGCCYRPRGDEFAALVERSLPVAEILSTAVAALTVSERFYSVVAAAGHALLPAEASTPIDALMVADRRLSTNAPRRGPRR